MTLTYISHASQSKAGRARARYRCECGTEFVAQVNNVQSGNTKSCGCARGTHHMTNTPLYSAWTNMRQRTTNRDIYPTYAEVHCDPRWLTFEGFLANPPPGRPFESGLCLARHGDSGDYTPENTRWVTRSENAREQRHIPKGHCTHGHEYTPENTKLGSDGRRRCRTCAIQRTREWRARLSSG